MKLLGTLAAAALVLSLVSCDAPHDYLPDYMTTPALVELSWDRDGSTYRGVLTLASDPDSYSLTYTYPPSLQGITVSRRGKDCFAEAFGVRICHASAAHMLAAATPYRIEGGKLLSVNEEDGARILEVTSEAGVYLLRFEKNAAFPTEAVLTASDGSRLTVRGEVKP